MSTTFVQHYISIATKTGFEEELTTGVKEGMNASDIAEIVKHNTTSEYVEGIAAGAVSAAVYITSK